MRAMLPLRPTVSVYVLGTPVSCERIEMPCMGSGVIYLLIYKLYKLFVCLFIGLTYFILSSLFSFLIPASLLVYFMTDLSTSFRIGPFCFQAGGRRR